MLRRIAKKKMALEEQINILEEQQRQIIIDADSGDESDSQEHEDGSATLGPAEGLLLAQLARDTFFCIRELKHLQMREIEVALESVHDSSEEARSFWAQSNKQVAAVYKYIFENRVNINLHPEPPKPEPLQMPPLGMFDSCTSRSRSPSCSGDDGEGVEPIETSQDLDSEAHLRSPSPTHLDLAAASKPCPQSPSNLGREA